MTIYLLNCTMLMILGSIMDIDFIIKLHDLAMKDIADHSKKREQIKIIENSAGKHFIGIAGPRGVGKTILLKQLAYNKRHAIYISLDSIEDVNLFELLHVLNEKYGKTDFYLDEIHCVKNYEQSLKMMYDFLDVKIIFTSSVALSIRNSVYDLSRRVQLYTLYPFSFREYLYFYKNIKQEKLTMENILSQEFSKEYFQYEYMFDDYFTGGLFPFSLNEPNVLMVLKNILDKVITKDIPSIASLKIDELPLIRKVIAFIGKSGIDGINYSSISKNIGITKYKAEEYLTLLQDAFICNIVFPEGTNVLREPKVLLNLPYRLLYRDREDAIGGLREDYFVETMRANSIDINYLKSNKGAKTPDYLINFKDENIVIEIGGKGKGREQFKNVSYVKKYVFAHGADVKQGKIPLFLLGFL